MKNNIRVLSLHPNLAKPILLLLLILLLFFYLMFAQPSGVSAHSELVKSEPQNGEILNESPAKVTVWFSEELDAEISTLRVFNSENNQVDNSDGGVDLNDLDHLTMVVGLPALQAGTYTVHWVTVSAEDDDKEEGDFTFNVGGRNAVDGSPSTPAANDSSTWLVSGGMILVVFFLLVWFLFLRKRTSV